MIGISRRHDPPSSTNIQRRHKPDYLLLILPVVMIVLGLIVVYAISPALSTGMNIGENYFVNRQIVAVLLSAASFFIVSNLPLSLWRKLEIPLLVAAGIASVVVRLFGEQINGAYRWIQVGGLSFQPAELIKFALILWLAGFLTDRLKKGELNDSQATMRPILIAMGIWGFVVAVLQSDLGSAAVIVATMGAMAFIAGLPLKRILMVGVLVTIGVVFAISTSAYRRERLQTFIQPTRDCQTTGYQTCQALIAVGSGGIFGLGLARSVQAYGYLPEAANDSIFAIYGEKFGFVGSSVLIGLFVALFARIKRVIERAPDDYTRLLAVGVLAWLSTQSIINIGAMIGLLPLKGITLPFISYGGTSLIFVSAAVALVFNISRYTTYEVRRSPKKEGIDRDNNARRRGERRPYYAAVGRRP